MTDSISSLQTLINTCRTVPFQVNFVRWRHLALVSIYLICPWTYATWLPAAVLHPSVQKPHLPWLFSSAVCTRNTPTFASHRENNRARVCKRLRTRSSGIDSASQCSLSYRTARNRFPVWGNRCLGIDFWAFNVYKYGLRLHRLAKSIPLNRFLGSFNVYKYGLLAHILQYLKREHPNGANGKVAVREIAQRK